MKFSSEFCSCDLRALDALTAKSFDQLLLNPELIRKIKEKDFYLPTPVQAGAIPLGLLGNDLLVQAKAGSGKRLVFSTLIAHGTIGKPAKRCFAVVLTPVSEVAHRIKDIIDAIVSTEASIGVFTDDEDWETCKKRVAEVLMVAVGTPHRMAELVKEGLMPLKECKLFVLDDADELMAQSYHDDINLILNSFDAKSAQIIASSVTYPKDLDSFLSHLMKSPCGALRLLYDESEPPISKEPMATTEDIGNDNSTENPPALHSAKEEDKESSTEIPGLDDPTAVPIRPSTPVSSTNEASSNPRPGWQSKLFGDPCVNDADQVNSPSSAGRSLSDEPEPLVTPELATTSHDNLNEEEKEDVFIEDSEKKDDVHETSIKKLASNVPIADPIGSSTPISSIIKRNTDTIGLSTPLSSTSKRKPNSPAIWDSICFVPPAMNDFDPWDVPEPEFDDSVGAYSSLPNPLIDEKGTKQIFPDDDPILDVPIHVKDAEPIAQVSSVSHSPPRRAGYSDNKPRRGYRVTSSNYSDNARGQYSPRGSRGSGYGENTPRGGYNSSYGYENRRGFNKTHGYGREENNRGSSNNGFGSQNRFGGNPRREGYNNDNGNNRDRGFNNSNSSFGAAYGHNEGFGGNRHGGFRGARGGPREEPLYMGGNRGAPQHPPHNNSPRQPQQQENPSSDLAPRSRFVKK